MGGLEEQLGHFYLKVLKSTLSCVDRCTQPDIDCNRGQGEKSYRPPSPCVAPAMPSPMWRGADTNKKIKSQHRYIHKVTTLSVSKIPFL